MRKKSEFEKGMDDWFKGKATQDFIAARCRERASDPVMELAREITKGSEEYAKRIMEGTIRYRRKAKMSSSKTNGCDLCIGTDKLTSVAKYELIGEPKAGYIPRYLCDFHYQNSIHKDDYDYKKIK